MAKLIKSASHQIIQYQLQHNKNSPNQFPTNQIPICHDENGKLLRKFTWSSCCHQTNPKNLAFSICTYCLHHTNFTAASKCDYRIFSTKILENSLRKHSSNQIKKIRVQPQTQCNIIWTTESRIPTKLSLIHIWRCRRIERCRSRWSPYH